MLRLKSVVHRLFRTVIPDGWRHLSQTLTNDRGTTHQESSELRAFGEFPKGFLWGVGTSAYQVEGGIEGNDWHVFTTSPSIKNRIRKLSRLVGAEVKLEPAGDGVRHQDLNVLRQDLDRLQALGINAFRFSIEWSRLQPCPPESTVLTDEDFDATALAYYDAVINEIVDRGLEPIVTLYHLSLPQWVSTPPQANSVLQYAGLPLANADEEFMKSLRGWENEETIQAYLRFIDFVVRKYTDRVQFWITQNETVGSVIGLGYIAGVWPPGFNLAAKRAKRAYFNLIKAHILAYERIKKLAPFAQVGVAHAMLFTKTAESRTGSNTLVLAFIGGVIGFVAGGWINASLATIVGATSCVLVGGALLAYLKQAAMHQFQYFYNEHFLNALINGQLDTSIHFRSRKRSIISGKEFQRFVGGDSTTTPWKAKLDFVGVNYYRAVYVYFHAFLAIRIGFMGGAFDNNLHGKKQPHGLLNDLGWEVCPEGMYRHLALLQERYGLPVLVTENGIPETTDRNRAAFIVAHLQQILRAIQEIEGLIILGYCYWTMLDNWELHEGYRPEGRFGLFTVDRSQSEQPRRLTEGGIALQYVITENTVSNALLRFGSVCETGQGVLAPTMSSGAIWEGHTDDGLALRLYLSHVGKDCVLGMVNYIDSGLWVVLEDFVWDKNTRKVEFTHEYWGSTNPNARWTYHATMQNKAIQGTVIHGNHAGSWQAERLDVHGLWRRCGDNIEVPWMNLCHFSRFGIQWNGKFYCPENPSRWVSLDQVRCVGDAIFCSGSFEESGRKTTFQLVGLVSDGTITGTFTIETPKGSTVSYPWQAQRLDDNLPF